MNLYFTLESCGTFKSFTTFIAVKTVIKLIWNTAINLNPKFENLAFAVHVLQKTQNLAFHFKEMY